MTRTETTAAQPAPAYMVRLFGDRTAAKLFGAGYNVIGSTGPAYWVRTERGVAEVSMGILLSIADALAKAGAK